MSELIEETWSHRNDDGLTALKEHNEAEIRDLLLGHKITKIADDHMELDNGTVVKVVPNIGGCSCGAGDYVLDELNECDNIITRVEFEENAGDTEDEGYEYGRTYRVFVVAEDKRINLFAVTGDDGSGYYGTGYGLLVRKAER